MQIVMRKLLGDLILGSLVFDGGLEYGLHSLHMENCYALSLIRLCCNMSSISYPDAFTDTNRQLVFKYDMYRESHGKVMGGIGEESGTNNLELYKEG